MKPLYRTAALAVTIAAGFMCGTAPAGAQQIASLSDLLEQTRTGRSKERAQHQEREQRFMRNRDEQADLLAETRRDRDAAQARGRELNARFEANEKLLAEKQAQLDAKVGSLGELFGVVRQTAGDTASVLHDSMISAQYPDREVFVYELAESRELPSIEQLERLWFEMQREMTETGTVVRFPATVIAADGTEAMLDVSRVGPFTPTAAGRYLTYQPDTRKFAELTRQPRATYRGVAADLENPAGSYVGAVIDPTRGSLLSVLVQQPGLRESVEYGGAVGYLIMTLAGIGFVIGLVRLLRLSAIAAAVRRQRKQIDKPFSNNPLGRVLMVYHNDPKVDHETLQLRLDAAVLKEVPSLEMGLGILKILAAVGPLMGLLGTVTGMIITFQQITLFGTGDPKLMAGGISQALVTTVMGLVMAIPLLLLHSHLSTRSGDLVNVLEEETAAIIAEQADRGVATA